MSVVLSLFPGIGLLDMAFEELGFCVVRGPDLLWGGDIHRFHAPEGVFSGVIGGPPCQSFSSIAQVARSRGHIVKANLIPEYERVVSEAKPDWFVMENVKDAPLPVVNGYVVRDVLLNNRWCGGEQNRLRRFSFGTPEGSELPIETLALEPCEYAPAVTAYATRWDSEKRRPYSDRSVKYLQEMIRLQGLPEGFLEDAPFTLMGKQKAIGNGVPLPMGRVIARAVRRYLEMIAKKEAA